MRLAPAAGVSSGQLGQQFLATNESEPFDRPRMLQVWLGGMERAPTPCPSAQRPVVQRPAAGVSTCCSTVRWEMSCQRSSRRAYTRTYRALKY